MAGDGRDGAIPGGPNDAVGPAGFDVSVAHPARVRNYLLGGKDNFAADREAAKQMITGGAKVLVGVRANRAFLGRAVRFLAEEAGLRQFLDIGDRPADRGQYPRGRPGDRAAEPDRLRRQRPLQAWL
jgi:hypothetical protein